MKHIYRRQQSIIALPVDLGLYIIAGCFLVHLIINTRINPYLLILMFSLSTTIVELIAVKLRKVIYRNG